MEQAPVTCAFFLFVSLMLSMTIVYVFYVLCLRAKILRDKLQTQGIYGPTPSLILGNLPDIYDIKSKELPSAGASTYDMKEHLSFDCRSILLPHITQWSKQFGKTMSFALGKVQILYIGNGELVKEISACKSLNLGKPSFLRKDRGPLFGKGILTSSKEAWVHQRKTISPTLYADKVKNMFNIVLDAGNTLVESWEKLVEMQGGIADIQVNDYAKIFSSSIISKIMFGRYDAATKTLFSKCKDLMDVSGSPTVLDGRPFYRFMPTKKNRDQWRLEKEIYQIVLELVEKCSTINEGDNLIDTLVAGAKNGELGSATPQEFIVDNCKELCLIGMYVPATTAMWGLMLLASHPEWQARARAEILEVCGEQTDLDAEKLAQMKILKMIIQEILRLYTGVGMIVRDALADIKIGDKVCIPKGVNIWIWQVTLHRDPELWGPDVLEFNPERFANGMSKACRVPQAYVPFGFGPRACPGMNLGMMELQLFFALILAKFSFSLSPNYRHEPKFDVILEPKYGVDLLVHKL